jgi:hypothetical protein
MIAFPEVVVEPSRYTPGVPSRAFRSVARFLPPLQAKLREDFVVPGHEMGVRGRCLVLRKLQDDDRDTQSRFHNAF